jgi:inositol-phosphate transport system permease protein
MAERSQPSANYRSWPVITALTIVSLPLLLMYVYLFLDTVTIKQADALLPSG